MSHDALKELLRRQVSAEAARETKVRLRDQLTGEIAELDAEIARLGAIIDGLDASSPAGGDAVGEQQPKRAPDPLSCRIIDYVRRNEPVRHSALFRQAQAWGGLDEDGAERKLSNISVDKAPKERSSRKRPYLLSFWREGEKFYELGPYGRANLPLVDQAIALSQKSSQKMTH